MINDNFGLFTITRNNDQQPALDIITRSVNTLNLNPKIVLGGVGADLVNQIWYKIEFAPAELINVESYYDLIEEIELTIGGQIIEKYSGTLLLLNSQYDKNSQCSWSSQHEIIFPLCTCTKNLPLLSLAFHKVIISIKLSNKIKDILKSHSFEVEYIYLPQDKRRIVAQNKCTSKICIQKSNR